MFPAFAIGGKSDNGLFFNKNKNVNLYGFKHNLQIIFFIPELVK